MFQYAIGRHLSIINRTKLILDISFLDQKKHSGYTYRNFGLDIFEIISKLKSGNVNFLTHCTATLKFKLGLCKYINEEKFAFMPQMLDLKGNLYLDGYWQSEKYFSDIKNVLIKDFSPKNQLTGLNEKIAKQIAQCNAISLHIRRGDYVTSVPTYNDLFASKYYQRAIEFITNSVHLPVFFIFSDDIPWVKQNMAISYPCVFVDHNHYQDCYIDLLLMSICKHHIIANSSFSWWGAWLNTNERKIVVAPSKWFNNPLIDSSDLIPTSWTVI
jgi:hypothetical protein